MLLAAIASRNFKSMNRENGGRVRAFLEAAGAEVVTGLGIAAAAAIAALLLLIDWI